MTWTLDGLPQDVICQILKCLPLSKTKLSLQALSRKWKEALCRPESHDVRLHNGPGYKASRIPPQMMKVLPSVYGTQTALSRIEAQGLEYLQAIWSIDGDQLSCIPYLPNLHTLHVGRGDEPLQLLPANFQVLGICT